MVIQNNRFTNIYRIPAALNAPVKRIHHYREHSATNSNATLVEAFDCLITVDKNGFVAVRELSDLDQLRCLIRLKGLTNFAVDRKLGTIICGTRSGRTRSFDLNNGSEILPSLDTYGIANVKLTEDRQYLLSQTKQQKIVLRQLLDSGAVFKLPPDASTYLVGRSFVDGRLQSAGVEQQIKTFQQRPATTPLSENHIQRWNNKLGRN